MFVYGMYLLKFKWEGANILINVQATASTHYPLPSWSQLFLSLPSIKLMKSNRLRSKGWPGRAGGTAIQRGARSFLLQHLYPENKSSFQEQLLQTLLKRRNPKDTEKLNQLLTFLHWLNSNLKLHGLSSGQLSYSVCQESHWYIDMYMCINNSSPVHKNAKKIIFKLTMSTGLAPPYRQMHPEFSAEHRKVILKQFC